MKQISIEIDGKKLTAILDDEMGYWSILGVFEGLLSEFIIRPDEFEPEEHDG